MLKLFLESVREQSKSPPLREIGGVGLSLMYANTAMSRCHPLVPQRSGSARFRTGPAPLLPEPDRPPWAPLDPGPVPYGRGPVHKHMLDA
jgi:hypothetical protein